jgi:hypothetical protein
MMLWIPWQHPRISQTSDPLQPLKLELSSMVWLLLIT